MIVLPHAQGSDEWRDARLGRPTASQFHRIVTPAQVEAIAKGRPYKPGDGAISYRRELLFEIASGEPARSFKPNSAMLRGTDLEDDAVRWFEMDRHVKVERVGLCLTDDAAVGASPDGFIGDDEGLEIKGSNGPAHIAAVLDGTGDYKAQCQGGLYVTGRNRWHLLLHCPGLESVPLAFKRDEAWQHALGMALAHLLTALAEEREELIRRGQPMLLEQRRAAAESDAKRDAEPMTPRAGFPVGVDEVPF